MTSKTAQSQNYLINRVLIYLAKANLEKKMSHLLKAVEYCKQAEMVLKEHLFRNENSEQCAVLQHLVLVLKTECCLDLDYKSKSNTLIKRLENLSERFPNVMTPLKVSLLRAEYEFQFNQIPLSANEWLTLLKNLFSSGEVEFTLEQFLRILKHYHKTSPMSHYEKLMNYYESLLRLCDKKIPLKSRKEFHAYYEYNPHHRVKVSPHHMMIKFIEISRELISEYHVPTLTRKVLEMMLDFTQMERGFILLNQGRDNSLSTTFRFRQKSLLDELHEDGLCYRLARFALKTGRTINISDLSLVNLNEQFLPDEYQSERWQHLKAKSLIVVPFLLDEHVLGVAYLDSKSKRAADNEDEITFLENFSMNVAIALNNADSFSKKDKDLQHAQKQLQEHRSELIQRYDIANFIGVAEKTRELLQVVQKIGDSHATVLVTGESGAGKEMIAKTIHYNSTRKNKPFIGINCGAIPEHLLESELFGYIKGSFTGADDSKLGLFEQAEDGTIFLDEIGELPMNMQVKLLRVLEESEVLPIGAAQPRKIQARVVCATNRNLEDMVQFGGFRKDLYFRINVVSINVPSLRERKADIPLLVQHALKTYAQENHVPQKNISADALNYLMRYPWPGNIRELVNVIHNLCIFIEHPEISLEDIKSRPELFQLFQLETERAEQDRGPDPLVELTQRIQNGELTLSEAKQEFEKLQILKALHASSGKITTASHILQMPRPQVSRLIKKYGLKEEEEYREMMI